MEIRWRAVRFLGYRKFAMAIKPILISPAMHFTANEYGLVAWEFFRGRGSKIEKGEQEENKIRQR